MSKIARISVAIVLLVFVEIGICGQVAPNFILYTTDGQRVELSDLRGRIVVLVFLDKRGGQSILTARSMETRLWRNNFQNRMIYLFGIVAGANQTEANEFKQGLNLTFPILADPDRTTLENYDQSGSLPTSVIIDRNGYIYYSRQGFSAEEIIQKVNELQSSNIYFTTWWKIKELFRKAD